MFIPRIIPCLLLHNSGLYKTVKFKDHKYVGDPVNAVKIFNEKCVDELIFLDIDASVLNKDINYSLLQDIASECFMPLCYGGGINSIDQMRTLFSIGIEKVSISSAAIKTPDLIRIASKEFGSQSIVVTMDIKKDAWGKSYRIFIHNGSQNTNLQPVEFAKRMEDLGAGELLINHIDRDGTFLGYDLDLAGSLAKSVDIPVVALGGAASLSDMSGVINKAGCSAAAAGSLFVFYGKHRAVLISYPDFEEIRSALEKA